MEKGSSLRVQRSNLIDSVPTWVEIAASPRNPRLAGGRLGVLAMTGSYLIPSDKGECR